MRRQEEISKMLQTFITKVLSIYIMSGFDATLTLSAFTTEFDETFGAPYDFSLKKNGEYIGVDKFLVFLFDRYHDFLKQEVKETTRMPQTDKGSGKKRPKNPTAQNIPKQQLIRKIDEILQKRQNATSDDIDENGDLIN